MASSRVVSLGVVEAFTVVSVQTDCVGRQMTSCQKPVLQQRLHTKDSTVHPHQLGARPDPPRSAPPTAADTVQPKPHWVPITEQNLLKFCSECWEFAPSRLWLPVAGGGRSWVARTGSGPMRMGGDIFAAAMLWRGRLLTTGRLSCHHPITVSGRSVAWTCSGRPLPSACWFSAV